MKIEIKTLVNGNYKEVLSRFDRSLFMALKPPLIQLNLTSFEGCTKGDKVEMELGIFGIKQIWKSLITDNQESNAEIFFIDEGVVLPPPLKSWKHKHILRNINDTETLIVDDIEYSSGNGLIDILLYPVMYFQFWYRKPIYRRYFTKQ